MKKQLWVALAAAGLAVSPLHFSFADDTKPADKAVKKESGECEACKIIKLDGGKLSAEQIKQLEKLGDLKGLEALENLKMDFTGLNKLGELKGLENVILDAVGDLNVIVDEEESEGEAKKDGQKKAKHIRVVRPGQGAGTNAAAKKENFLGVSTETVPEVLSSQLPGLVAKGQGVLVTNVVAKSAAEKAGIKKNDILTAIGEKKITDPDQFRKLITSQSAGAKVTVDLIRGGKAKEVSVTLEQRDSNGLAARVLDGKDWREMKLDAEALKALEKAGDKATEKEKERAIRAYTLGNRIAKEVSEKVGENQRRRWVMAAPDENASVNLQIISDATSVSVNVSNKDVKVDVKYKDKDGKEVSKEFSGTREDVLKKIESLPEAQRNMIKKALDIKATGSKAGSFQFEMSPLNHSKQKAHRIKVETTKTDKAAKAEKTEKSDKAVRKMKVSGIIDIDEIMKQLGDVPPEVRENIEKTLRNIEIQRPDIKIERGQ